MRSLESFGAVADGHMGSPSDNAPAFQEAALWASENGGSVYAKTRGQFGIAGSVRMPGVTFRMNDSVIVPFGTKAIGGLIFSGRQGKAIAIARDVEEGSKEVELADATGIEKGSWLSLQSKPDTTLPMRFTLIAQAVQVEGNWVGLSLPLTFPMSLSDQEAIVVPVDLLEGGGVEDCLIDMSLYDGQQVRGVRAMLTRNQTYDLRIVRDNSRTRSDFSEAGMTMWGGYGNTAFIEGRGVGTAGLYDFNFQQQTMGDVCHVSHNCPASPNLVTQGSYNRARLSSFGAFGRGLRIYSERHGNFPDAICEGAGMTGLSLAYGTAHCGFNGFRLRGNGGPNEAGLWLNGQGGIDYNQFTNGSSLDSGGPTDIEIRGRGNLVKNCPGRINDLGEETVIV